MEAQHTAAPWSINEWPQAGADIAIGAQGTPLIAKVVLRDVSINEQKANAEFIVRACNAHDDLVKALKLTLSGLENGSVKSKPIIDFSDENAESLPIMSLASVIRSALAKAGAA